jgi:hypothetical protein
MFKWCAAAVKVGIVKAMGKLRNRKIDYANFGSTVFLIKGH